MVWDHLSVEQEGKVEAILNAGMRIILEAPSTVTGTEMRQKLDWTTLAQRRKLHTPRRFTGPSTEQGLHASTISFSDLSDGQTRGSSSGKFTFTTLKQTFRVCHLCSFNVATIFFLFWGGGAPLQYGLLKGFFDLCLVVLEIVRTKD